MAGKFDDANSGNLFSSSHLTLHRRHSGHLAWVEDLQIRFSHGRVHDEFHRSWCPHPHQNLFRKSAFRHLSIIQQIRRQLIQRDVFYRCRHTQFLANEDAFTSASGDLSVSVLLLFKNHLAHIARAECSMKLPPYIPFRKGKERRTVLCSYLLRVGFWWSVLDQRHPRVSLVRDIIRHSSKYPLWRSMWVTLN